MYYRRVIICLCERDLNIILSKLENKDKAEVLF